MHATLTPPEISSLEQARSVVSDQFQQLQQLAWRVEQLEKELYGPSSERQVPETLSKEQILLSLFPAATLPQPRPPKCCCCPLKMPRRAGPPAPATGRSKVIAGRWSNGSNRRRKFVRSAARPNARLAVSRANALRYVPAKVIRHQIVRPKLALSLQGRAEVSIAPLPPQVVEQGQAGERAA